MGDENIYCSDCSREIRPKYDYHWCLCFITFYGLLMAFVLLPLFLPFLDYFYSLIISLVAPVAICVYFFIYRVKQRPICPICNKFLKKLDQPHVSVSQKFPATQTTSEESRYCPKCGEKLDSDSNFCKYCGGQI